MTNDIVELAALCTSINIQAKFKVNHEGKSVACEIKAHVCIKSEDGHFQYADINVGADSVELAIGKALKIAQAYHAEASK